jgi:hypothetical protein
MFDLDTDDEITFPWDTELEELALSDQTNQLDEYIGVQIIVQVKIVKVRSLQKKSTVANKTHPDNSLVRLIQILF